MGIVLLVIATTLSLITGTIHPGSLGARLGILGLAMTLFPWVESFRARYGRRRRRPSNTPLGAQAIAGRFERALYVSYDLPLFPIRGSGTLRTDRSGMHLVGRPVTTPVRAWIHVGGLLLTGFATALALLLTPAAWWAVGGILLVWLALVRWAPHPPRIIEHFVPWDHVELAREDGGGRVEIRVRPPTQFLGDELTAGAIFFRSDARSRLLETIAAQLGL